MLRQLQGRIPDEENSTRQEAWKNDAGSISEEKLLGAVESIKWNHTQSQGKCMLFSFDYRFSHSEKLKKEQNKIIIALYHKLQKDLEILG